MTNEASPTHSGSAWCSRGAWMALLVSAVLGLAVDLWTKWYAFRNVAPTPVVIARDEVLAKAAEDPRLIGTLVPQHAPVEIVPKVLSFTLVLNPGAVFGIGPGRRWFFIAFTAVAMAFAMLMFARWTRARDRWAQIGIGLLIAGGLGNFYDRLAYGCVRDFIHPLPGVKFPGGWDPWNAGGQVWPYVSNVADLWLIVGILILAVYLWRRDAQLAKARAAAAPVPAPAEPPAS